jgi:hypothetical protein
MWKCHLISQTRQDGHYFQWDWNIFDSFLSTCTWRLRPIIWPWLKMFDIICRKWMKIATWCDMLMSLPIPSYTSFLSHARPYPMAIKLKCPLNHSWFSLVPSPTCPTATSHFLLVKSQTKIQVNHGEPSLDLDFFGFHPIVSLVFVSLRLGKAWDPRCRSWTPWAPRASQNLWSAMLRSTLSSHIRTGRSGDHWKCEVICF